MTRRDGSPQRMALDNIFRRELRVSDPSDPMQIAQALLTRYKDNPRAQAISQEAKGLPFLQAADAGRGAAGRHFEDAELQQAGDDVERDLHELTTNALLKDVTPELQGWAQAVRSADHRRHRRRALRARSEAAGQGLWRSVASSATMRAWPVGGSPDAR